MISSELDMFSNVCLIYIGTFLNHVCLMDLVSSGHFDVACDSCARLQPLLCVSNQDCIATHQEMVGVRSLFLLCWNTMLLKYIGVSVPRCLLLCSVLFSLSVSWSLTSPCW